jgi:hypothetical protein
LLHFFLTIILRIELKLTIWLGAVAQTCNPSYYGGRGSWLEASLGKKFARPYLNQWLVEVVPFIPSYTRKHNEETHGACWPRNKARLYLKNNQFKRAGSVAQMVVCLPNK